MPDQGWEDCVRLSADFTDAFGYLLDDIEKNEKAWKSVSFYLFFVQNQQIPEKYHKSHKEKYFFRHFCKISLHVFIF